MSILEIAINWVSQGFSVIPIKYYSKRPSINSWEPYQKRLPYPEELSQWFRSSLTNIALITGWSNLLVIDFDVMDVFNYWYSLFRIDTYMVKTSRGVHVYIQTEIPSQNYHSPLLDIKAERGYVLIPPSIHPSGAQYGVLLNAPILKIHDLRDILPSEFTPEPERIVKASYISTNENHFQLEDPWESADNAVEIDGNAVEKIRKARPLLSYFPNAIRTSSDGRWWVDSCPFHNDANPSFWIDSVRGLCGCRVCNIKELDVINLHARLNKLSNRESIVELIKNI
jgi:hypothetical protein